MFGMNIICLFESIHKYSTILSFCSKGNQMTKEMFTTLLWIKSVEEVQIQKLPRLNMETDCTLVQLSMLVILYRFISSNQNWSSRNFVSVFESTNRTKTFHVASLWLPRQLTIVFSSCCRMRKCRETKLWQEEDKLILLTLPFGIRHTNKETFFISEAFIACWRQHMTCCNTAHVCLSVKHCHGQSRLPEMHKVSVWVTQKSCRPILTA